MGAIKAFAEMSCAGRVRTHKLPVEIAPEISEEMQKAYTYALTSNGCVYCPMFNEDKCRPYVMFGENHKTNKMNTATVQPISRIVRTLSS
ncbi:MAG: hypothetical protein ACOYT9_01235 [Patescibacteria group bacterium]